MKISQIKFNSSNLFLRAGKTYLQFVGRKRIKAAICLPIFMIHTCIGQHKLKGGTFQNYRDKTYLKVTGQRTTGKCRKPVG
jgi:hypothetical protein